MHEDSPSHIGFLTLRNAKLCPGHNCAVDPPERVNMSA
jgi:hypothetical protein